MKKITLFQNIEKYLDDLEEIVPKNEDEFLSNKEKQYSVSMIIMNIINACIDIGQEIIINKQYTYPGSYKEVFETLHSKKIINKNISSKMKELVGLRNLLAHEYGTINFEILFETVQDLEFVEKYLQKTINEFD